jgi:hypothetical protein
MFERMRKANCAYALVRSGSSALVEPVFGFGYIAIGAKVLLETAPQLSGKHLAYWQSGSGMILGLVLAAIVGGCIQNDTQTLPAYRGRQLSIIFAVLLFFWPSAFLGLDKWAEPVVITACLLILLGVMNLLEAMQSTGSDGSPAGKSRLARPDELGSAGILIVRKR